MTFNKRGLKMRSCVKIRCGIGSIRTPFSFLITSNHFNT